MVTITWGLAWSKSTGVIEWFSEVITTISKENKSKRNKLSLVLIVCNLKGHSLFLVGQFFCTVSLWSSEIASFLLLISNLIMKIVPIILLFLFFYSLCWISCWIQHSHISHTAALQPNHARQTKNNPAILSTQKDSRSQTLAQMGKLIMWDSKGECKWTVSWDNHRPT